MNAAIALAWMRYLGERLGWPGLLGIVLALAAVAADIHFAAELEERNAALQSAIAQWRTRLAAQPVDLPAAESRALSQLPGGSDLAPFVSTVHAKARDRKIALEQGEYVWQGESGKRAARYRMQFPVRGSYPQLRGWAADVLSAQPELVLEEFSFRRDEIGSEMVDARVRFAVGVAGRT